MDVDYTDDLALLLNTPSPTESLLDSLGQAARGIGLYVNQDKTEFMCLKQDGAICTLYGNPLKYSLEKHRVLLTGSQSFENLISLIK